MTAATTVVELGWEAYAEGAGCVMLGVEQTITSRPGPRVTMNLAQVFGGDGPTGDAEVTVNLRLAAGHGVLLAVLDDAF